MRLDTLTAVERILKEAAEQLSDLPDELDAVLEECKNSFFLQNISVRFEEQFCHGTTDTTVRLDTFGKLTVRSDLIEHG